MLRRHIKRLGYTLSFVDHAAEERDPKEKGGITWSACIPWKRASCRNFALSEGMFSYCLDSGSCRDTIIPLLLENSILNRSNPLRSSKSDSEVSP